MFRKVLLAAAVAAALAAQATAALAADDAPLDLAGRTVRFLIPSSTGSSTDLQGRLIARHLARHLPGNPNVIAQNISGGTGLKLMAYLNSLDGKTDLVIATVNSSLPFRARAGTVAPDVFDPTKAQWIGSAVDSTNICLISAADDTGDVNTLRTKELAFGATQKGSGGYSLYMILNRGLGFRIKPIVGYDNNATTLAIVRDEIDGECTPKAAYSAVKPYIDEGKMRLFLYLGPNRRDDLDAPYAFDLPMSEEQREFLKLSLASISFGRPLAVHPDAPPAFLATARKAFAAMVSDPEYIREAASLGVDVRYTSPEDLARLVADLYTTSDAKIAEIAELIGAE